MIEIYEVNLDRNKSYYQNKSPGSLKKELYREICDSCKKDFKIGRLELEHKIPVRVGGEIFRKKNLQLYCSLCHSRKTKLDIKVMNILKKIGLFDNHHFYISPDKVIIEFKRIRKLISKSELNYKTWYQGSNGINYKQIFWTKNREVESGTKKRS